MWGCDLDGVKNEDPYLLQVFSRNLFEMKNINAEEIEVYFCSYLFVQHLVEVVGGIGRFHFSLLEMGVKFAVILEQQVEDLLFFVDDQGNFRIAIGDCVVWEGRRPDKETFENVNHLYFEFWIWNPLVNGQEYIKSALFFLSDQIYF